MYVKACHLINVHTMPNIFINSRALYKFRVTQDIVSNSEGRMFLSFSSLNGPSGSLNATLPSSSFSTWNRTLRFLICPLLLFLLSQNSQTKTFPILLLVQATMLCLSFFSHAHISNNSVMISILLSGFCLSLMIEIAFL